MQYYIVILAIGKRVWVTEKEKEIERVKGERERERNTHTLYASN